MSAATPGITRIGQIAIVIDDLERATVFYRDVLGLKFLFAAPPGLAFFDCGGIRLMLSRPEGSERGNSVFYFPVDDIQAGHQALAAHGVTFEGEPHVVHRGPGYELWMAFFRDSENNLLALMQENRSA